MRCAISLPPEARCYFHSAVSKWPLPSVRTHGMTSISGTSASIPLIPSKPGVTPAERSCGTFSLNISASPYWNGQADLRRDMLATIARNYKVPVAMVNQVGGNDSLIFDGSSVDFDPSGNLIAQGKSFEEDLLYFDSDRLTGE